MIPKICSSIIFMHLMVQEASSFAGRNPNSKRIVGNKTNFNRNKSNENKRQGYLKRSSGIKTKRKKPPKWEQEGDAMFFLHQSEISDQDVIEKEYSSPRQLLESKFKVVDPDTEGNDNSVGSTIRTVEKENAPKAKSPFMWGSVSAGPIMSPKLNALFPEPTPIQSQAFKALSKSKNGAISNVVVASPTGSGKTLAYIVPLLANTKRDDFGRILIVTPTQDLAFQIQRVVDQLWAQINNYSGMYVVQPPRGEDIDLIQGLTVAEMKLCKSPIIAGTPKSLMTLVSYCRKNNVRLFDNLTSIVLDEADRLLQTELVARGEGGRQNKESLTAQLLDEIQKVGISFDKDRKDRARLICASATVGRTLRKQLMEITGSSSIEKTAELVTADDRTGKDETKRKSSLLPSTIQHSYALYKDEENLVGEMWEIMKKLPPAPTLIFPGKMGVVKMVEGLQAFNLDYVNTLRDEVHWDESAEENSNDTHSWEKTPIFVVGEKFARGLDIPNVKYVFLAAPSTSPAAYTHLAGRTGRGGKQGSCITFVQGMKEAIRLVSLADILGLTYAAADGVDVDVDDLSLNNEPITDTEVSRINVDQIDNVDLGNLSVVQLKDMLREKGLKVSGRKSELIERIHNEI